MVLNMSLAIAYGVAKASILCLHRRLSGRAHSAREATGTRACRIRTDAPKLFALTYASLKDDELKAYIEFNRTKGGQIQ